MLGLDTGIGFATRRAVNVALPAAPFAAPPVDWRMAATVARSSGPAADLSAAQATSASRGRPNVAMAAGDWIAWSVAATDTPLLLSFVGGVGTVAISADSTNGADGFFADAGFVARFPVDSTVAGANGNGGRRQHCLITAGPARTVKLTATEAVTLSPLLHKLPAAGPWDAHVAFGASREDQGMGSRNVEEAIIAAFPTRDPVVFNYAKSGADAGVLDDLVFDLVAAYTGVASYVTLGSLIGNNVSAARPYDAAEKASLDTSLDTILHALSGFVIGFGNTSYRAYPGVTPDAQGDGSLPYNENVIHPKILQYAPACYDVNYGRARIDEYTNTLFTRGSLSDGVHGSGEQYAQSRTFWADQWYRYIYTGSWGTPPVERRVAAAEAARAPGPYDEAAYAVAALTASRSKTALLDRLAAVRPDVLLSIAGKAINAAETSRTQADKTAAQTAIDEADAAGANAGTVSAYRARIEAISIVAIIQTVRIGHGGTTAVAGWNRSGATALGIAIPNLVNDVGAAAGWGYEITNAASGASANTGLASQVAGIPSAILASTITDTANQFGFSITGLDNGKVYDLTLMPSRSTTAGKTVRYMVNGAVQSPDIEAANNVGVTLTVTGVVPVGGVITVSVARGAGSSFAYHTATLIAERAP